MEIVGKIHSLESLGTVDGPGLRFVVFMQGCPLKCKYCHNRDTWELNEGKEYTVEKLLNKILRVKSYIDSSHGGVTISGGEPLLQAKFVTELFKRLQDMGIHTALDTAGSLSITSEIKELLKYTDLVLLDIKHIDDEKCINLTGASNRNNLAFARYLSSSNIPVWIRQVLVPGITDDKQDLLNLKDFLSSLDNIEKIEILPYHNLGKEKWIKLGKTYPLEGVPVAPEEDVTKAKEILCI